MLPVSTTLQVILITALVLGIVAAVLGVIKTRSRTIAEIARLLEAGDLRLAEDRMARHLVTWQSKLRIPSEHDPLAELRDAGTGIVVVTHDYEFVCAACDQVAVLEDGVVSDVLPVRGEALGRIRRAIGIDGRARPL